ncbi:MAG: hypothetical protein IPH08_02935 [Rhodocyclaceae bacterium]|jgi:hypothetical protein|nr:hypothetical protein [Rhodocyclaceae bacterium]
MKRINCVALLAVVLTVLAGCGSQQAGYQIVDRHHSISVSRDQQYPGSKWDTKLVVSRFPECQRRYTLAPSGDKFKMDLYRVEPGVFILNQGKTWYVAETKECRHQKFDSVPPEPGELIGTFQTKEEELVFVSKEKKGDDEAAKKPAADK